MGPEPTSASSARLKSAIADLRALQALMLSDDLPPFILSEFRDALNRVRTAAWAAQQSVAAKLLEQGSTNVVSLLAAERVRTAYQLCRAIQEDLHSDDIQFQKGQLSELRGAAIELAAKLKDKV